MMRSFHGSLAKIFLVLNMTYFLVFFFLHNKGFRTKLNISQLLHNVKNLCSTIGYNLKRYACRRFESGSEASLIIVDTPPLN
jgi:hypothetical protein